MMQAIIIDVSEDLSLATGICGEYKFYAKISEEITKFGIDEERIIKLIVFDKDNDIVIHYDRDWIIKPCNSYLILS